VIENRIAGVKKYAGVRLLLLKAETHIGMFFF
jgi:hypothetical protein